MFVRSLFLSGREAPIILQYRTMESLEKSRAALTYMDDFGRQFHGGGMVIAELTTDVTRELEANGDIALLQGRENARLNTRAQNDPVLKFAAAGRGGLIG